MKVKQEKSAVDVIQKRRIKTENKVEWARGGSGTAQTAKCHRAGINQGVIRAQIGGVCVGYKGVAAEGVGSI
jgi:hypothetical protein